MEQEQNQVGPILEHGQTARAIIAAMHDLNPGMTITDRGSYLRVCVPTRCVLSRHAVEEILGQDFVLPGDLEAVMPSFIGNLRMTEDEAVWDSRKSP